MKNPTEVFDDEPGDVVRKPRHPTGHLPGSPEKMAVMADRVRARVSLFHPQDGVWRDANGVQMALFAIREESENNEE